jgi:hypothetical protein
MPSAGCEADKAESDADQGGTLGFARQRSENPERFFQRRNGSRFIVIFLASQASEVPR